jgi:hypothetical protein
MTAIKARLDVIRREMLGPSPAHNAALRLLQAKLAKHGKKVRASMQWTGKTLYVGLVLSVLAPGRPLVHASCKCNCVSTDMTDVVFCSSRPNRCHCMQTSANLYPEHCYFNIELRCAQQCCRGTLAGAAGV